MRNEEFFKTYDINVVLDSEVTNINYSKSFVETSCGKHWHFEKLLLATGGTPRIPNVTGASAISKVHVLRNWDDLK